MNMTTQFPCTCGGCRNYAPHVSRAYYQGEHYLSSVTDGPFFSADAMRFFRTRISHVALLNKPGAQYAPEDSGIAVILSNKRESDAPREYELVTICKWGHISREWDDANYQIRKYDTLRDARRALSTTGYPMGCQCHGCVLDREGRG